MRNNNTKKLIAAVLGASLITASDGFAADGCECDHYDQPAICVLNNVITQGTLFAAPGCTPTTDSTRCYFVEFTVHVLKLCPGQPSVLVELQDCTTDDGVQPCGPGG